MLSETAEVRINMRLIYYQDPGHGWVKVSKELLFRLRIDSMISKYSYMNDTHAFLEEDCDLPILMKALKELGITPEFDVVYQEESPIREYTSYRTST